MPTNRKRATIIGAGIGGLATAALLSKEGFETIVIEKRDDCGGRASRWECGGFRFDMGPSWYLMPDIVERFFGLFGRSSSDFYKLIRLDPSYKIFFGAGDCLEISSDLKKNLELFESLEPGSSEAFLEYLQQAKAKYEIAVTHFLYKEIRGIGDFLNKNIMDAGKDLHIFDNLSRYTRRFFSSDKLRKVLEYSMVFLGGAPSNTPALYSMLAHVDFNLGVWYPEGGMWSLVQALESLARECGATIIRKCEATKIEVRNGCVFSVTAGDDAFPADVIVANADYPFVETRLLERQWQSYPERYWQKRILAPSAVIMYLGINKKLPNLEHHSLSFEHDWAEHFDSIFKKKAWPEKPSLYFCCPTKTDASVAPPNCENLVTLVPVAPGLEDNDEARENICRMTFQSLERLTGVDVEKSAIVKRVFSHRDYKSEYNAREGTALGLSHTLMQSAMFRPKIASKKVKGLYYVGQYTHPGIGVPMALISATVATGKIIRDFG